MIGLLIGIGLLLLGAILFVIGRQASRQVAASQGAVAVGGDNRGQITNISSGSTAAPTHGHGLTYVAIAVELIGIVVTLWHAWHLTAK
jgi:hypothetical protein